MVERVKITITPSVTDSGLLEIQHAMQQVLDFFALLSHVDKSTSANEKPVVWHLLKATANSPLMVEAQAHSRDPAINVDRQAILAEAQLSKGIDAVVTGKPFPAWLDQQAENVLRSFLNRNLNGIGRTDIFMRDELEPIVISHRIAKQAMNHLDAEALKREAEKEDYTHTEYGSIEGELFGVGSYYNKPSFSLRERLSGREVTCITSGESADKIGIEHYLSEVWKRKRILVEGRLMYNEKGEIEKVEAYDISILEPKNIPVEKIYDPQFTGGLSPSEYLEKIREGDLD